MTELTIRSFYFFYQLLTISGKQCVNPPLPNLFTQVLNDSNTYFYQDEILIGCLTGYEIKSNENRLIECRANKEWGPIPSCTGIYKCIQVNN